MVKKGFDLFIMNIRGRFNNLLLQTLQQTQISLRHIDCDQTKLYFIYQFKIINILTIYNLLSNTPSDTDKSLSLHTNPYTLKKKEKKRY